MIVIHKFLMNEGKTKIELPAGHKVVACNQQVDLPYIWVMLDDALPLKTHTFYTKDTGEPLSTDEMYVGTIFFEYNRYVLHVFKEMKTEMDRLSDKIKSG